MEEGEFGKSKLQLSVGFGGTAILGLATLIPVVACLRLLLLQSLGFGKEGYIYRLHKFGS